MIEPIEFLGLAKKLIDNKQWKFIGEENVRTSVSRAYYFIFLKIKKELEALGVIFPKLEVHKEVADKLINTQLSQAVNVGTRLGDLKIKRSKADYHLKLSDFENGTASAELAIAEAEHIEMKFDEINKSTLRSSLKP